MARRWGYAILLRYITDVIFWRRIVWRDYTELTRLPAQPSMHVDVLKSDGAAYRYRCTQTNYCVSAVAGVSRKLQLAPVISNTVGALSGRVRRSATLTIEHGDHAPGRGVRD